MNRPLKFRIWRLDLDRMEYAEAAATLIDGVLTPVIADVELMQFTGVTDRDGTEVYEGDIVEAWDRGSKATRIVIYRCRGGGAPLFLLYPAFQDGEWWHLNSPHDHALTVVGNIYETPDLFEKVLNRATVGPSRDDLATFLKGTARH